MYNKKEIYEALCRNGAPLQAFTAPDIKNLPEYTNLQFEILHKRAEELEKKEITVLPYSLFNQYWQTGDRKEFQREYFARRERLLVFSLMQWATPCEKYLSQLEDIIWAICEEQSWCIPAHFLDAEEDTLDFEDFETQIDLFAAETGFALAECLSINEAALSKRVVQQINIRLNQRIFEPFLSGDRFFRFEHMANNWSAVCAGAVGGAALYILDGVPLVNIIHRALSCTDVFLDSFGSDGICVEGINYWTYGFGFYTCFAELLMRRSSGSLNLFDLPKVRHISTAQQACFLQNGKTISFADGSENAGFRMGLSCYLQKLMDAQIPDTKYALNILDDKCFRFCHALRDISWFNSNASFGLAYHRENYYPDAQWFISHTENLSLAAKGGNNNESHNHNDCGSFVLMKNGDMALCDFGASLYDAKYFSNRRYEVFVNATRSHNVALPDNCEQAAGEEYAAENVEFDFGAQTNVFSFNLEHCYPSKKLQSYHRQLIHNKKSNSVELLDTVLFSSPASLCEVFVSHCPFEVQGGIAFTGSGAGKLEIHFDAMNYTTELLSEKFLDNNEREHKAYILHIKSKADIEKFVFSALLK